jgi:transcription antitermination factor NusG
MSAGTLVLQENSMFLPENARWYAVHTRARHEKRVAQRLEEQGVTTFLPLVGEIHRWSDRRKKVELPLFSCYVFIKVSLTGEQRLRIYRVNGVFGIVGTQKEAVAIPDYQIDSVHTLIAQQLPWAFHPFLKIGQRVRVRGGSLDGVEGVLQRREGDRTLLLSVDAIQRCLAVRIEGYDVEPV